jgi:alpha-tubulin suppressor-like RCC1 family protein
LQGEAYCWGNRFRGKLGDDELSGSSPIPVKVVGNLTFVTMSASAGTTCAIDAASDLHCWGVNDLGLLGDGQAPEGFKESARPRLVVGGHKFFAIAVGGYSACGITTAGQVYCWGQSVLGDPTVAPTSVPVAFPDGHSWKAVVSGSGHTCALTTLAKVYCWGNNEHGQLGNGTLTANSPPAAVTGDHQYVAIASGGRHTCGLDFSGRAYCWGRGNFGQLGNGVATDRTAPTAVRNP